MADRFLMSCDSFLVVCRCFVLQILASRFKLLGYILEIDGYARVTLIYESFLADFYE